MYIDRLLGYQLRRISSVRSGSRDMAFMKLGLGNPISLDVPFKCGFFLSPVPYAPFPRKMASRPFSFVVRSLWAFPGVAVIFLVNESLHKIWRYVLSSCFATVEKLCRLGRICLIRAILIIQFKSQDWFSFSFPGEYLFDLSTLV